MPLPAPEPLESALELLLVLESVAERLTLEGPWRFQALLVTVAFPDRVIVGNDRSRLWLAPVGREKELHGLMERELLATRRGTRPQLLLDEAMWRYESRKEGPLSKRFVPIDRDDERSTVQQAVRAGIAEVLRFRRDREQVVATLGDAPPWERCVVCSHDPRLSFFPFRGEGSPPERVAVREHYLEVLGAPLFNDFGSSREWCLKRCPLCATHYLWKSDYEYLVNGGTETSTSLERLTPEELQPLLARVEDALRRGQR